MNEDQKNRNHERWNVESLKEYMDLALCGVDKSVNERFDSMEKAVIKAEVAHEKRLESMNEFRGQLMDQSKTFVPRSEFELVAKKLEKIENIKQGGMAVWVLIVGISGFLTGFITIALKLLGK